MQVVVALAFLVGSSLAVTLPDPCDDVIYCKPGQGGVLHTVQMARLYNDSKTFVDKPMKHDESVVLYNFQQMMQVEAASQVRCGLTPYPLCRPLCLQATGGNPSKDDVQTFVDENFLEEGNEFTPWEPEDWHENPDILNRIKVGRTYSIS